MSDTTYTNYAGELATFKVSLEELAATHRKFSAEQRRVDEGLVGELRKLLPAADDDMRTKAVIALAFRMEVSPMELDDYLYGKRPVSARFWEQVGRWIEAERKAR